MSAGAGFAQIHIISSQIGFTNIDHRRRSLRRRRSGFFCRAAKEALRPDLLRYIVDLSKLI